MERQFSHIAKVIKDIRVGAELSQSKLSTLLGYKNGQFISNVERGLCSIPATVVPAIVRELEVPSETIINAMVDDFRANLEDIIVVREPTQNTESQLSN